MIFPKIVASLLTQQLLDSRVEVANIRLIENMFERTKGRQNNRPLFGQFLSRQSCPSLTVVLFKLGARSFLARYEVHIKAIMPNWLNSYRN
jgi:hypothetical protein